MFLSGQDVHPVNFYEKINKIHNCLVVSPEENSNFLLKKSKATASIAGTNLIEGICLNKPAFRFGDYNLDFLNGIYKFDEKTFFTNLFKKDFNNLFENSYLFQAIYEYSFETDYDKYCFGYEKK